MVIVICESNVLIRELILNCIVLVIVFVVFVICGNLFNIVVVVLLLMVESILI